jgi:hypothetical protein
VSAPSVGKIERIDILDNIAIIENIETKKRAPFA